MGAEENSGLTPVEQGRLSKLKEEIGKGARNEMFSTEAEGLRGTFIRGIRRQLIDEEFKPVEINNHHQVVERAIKYLERTRKVKHPVFLEQTAIVGKRPSRKEVYSFMDKLVSLRDEVEQKITADSKAKVLQATIPTTGAHEERTQFTQELEIDGGSLTVKLVIGGPADGVLTLDFDKITRSPDGIKTLWERTDVIIGQDGESLISKKRHNYGDGSSFNETHQLSRRPFDTRVSKLTPKAVQDAEYLLDAYLASGL